MKNTKVSWYPSVISSVMVRLFTGCGLSVEILLSPEWTQNRWRRNLASKSFRFLQVVDRYRANSSYEYFLPIDTILCALEVVAWRDRNREKCIWEVQKLRRKPQPLGRGFLYHYYLAQGISHTSQQGHNLWSVQLVTENGSDVPHTACSATLSSLQGLFNKLLLQVC